MEARDCQRYNQDKSAWISTVASRVLSWGIHPTGVDALDVNSIQTQAINTDYLPRIISSTIITKKADMVISHSLREPSIERLCSRASSAGYSLSQMTGTYTNRVLMAAGAEIKQASGDAQLALAQLALWFTAGILHLRDLQRIGRAKQQLKGVRPLNEMDSSMRRQQDLETTIQPTDLVMPRSNPAATVVVDLVDPNCEETTPNVGDLLIDDHAKTILPEDGNQPSQPIDMTDVLPMVGWTAVGHEWRTFIACDTATEGLESRRIEVFGPLPKLNAGTANIYEIFKLLSSMRRVKAYARTERWRWLEKAILRPLVES